jgi:hypothetical protein
MYKFIQIVTISVSDETSLVSEDHIAPKGIFLHKFSMAVRMTVPLVKNANAKIFH